MLKFRDSPSSVGLEPATGDGPFASPGVDDRALPQGCEVLRGRVAGPRVAVLGAVHGDEPVGLRTLDALKAAFAAGTLPLRGELVLIHGNPAASGEGRRYTRGGEDLNRAFAAPQDPRSVEARRAAELRPLLETLDAAIDLHSASAPTAPFAVALGGDASLTLARRLGLGRVTCGWERRSDVGEGSALGVVASRGGPAIAVECGQHDDQGARVLARRVTACFLREVGSLGALAGQSEPPRPEEASLLTIAGTLPKPTSSFRFARPVVAFEQLRAGAILGHADGAPVRVPESLDGTYALLPNDRVPVGVPVVYFARRVAE
ncbi:MAG: succinylglutamate desuccinylase/aspartoacylase family protein [Myxococcota bacterium]